MAGRGRTIIIIAFFVLSFAHLAVGRKRRHRGPETVFNVLKFGAIEGGTEDCTEAFVNAFIAACKGPQAKGKTRLVVPQGVFLVSASIYQGPCTASSIVVEILGTIKADTDISNYPDNAWLIFDSIDNMLITGSGRIDGQGEKVWEYNDCKRNAACTHLPSAIKFHAVSNTLIRGINMQNAMGFNLHITRSRFIRIKGIRITAPAKSPNTDGIHISRSNNCKIVNTFIGTGDDCISLGQGVVDLSVFKVICGPGHGISVGSLGKYKQEEDVRGFTVTNCTLMGTTNGLRIKTWPGSDPSKASNIVFKNILMRNVENPIIIDQSYGDGDPVTNPSRVQISDIVFENIIGTTTTPVAVNLMCSKRVPCYNVQLNNVQLRTTNGKAISSFCSDAKVGYGGMQSPHPC